jgi:hypothetical protein
VEGFEPLRRGKPRRVADPVLGVTAGSGKRTTAGSKALEWGDLDCAVVAESPSWR